MWLLKPSLTEWKIQEYAESIEIDENNLSTPEYSSLD